MGNNNTESQSNKVAEEVKTEKKIHRSPVYAIKQFNIHVKNVETLKLLPPKELEELKALAQKILEYYMGKPML